MKYASKLLTVMVAAVAIILTGCSSEDKDMLRAMPADVVALARIDLKATAEGMDYQWNDLVKLASDGEMEDVGIDFSGKAYAFVTKDMQGGVVVPVKDADKLLAAMGKDADKRGDIYVVSSSAAFDGKRLLMGEFTNDEVKRLRRVWLDTPGWDDDAYEAYQDAQKDCLCQLLGQGSVDDSNKDIISQVGDIEEPVAGVMDGALFTAIGKEENTIAAALALLPFNCNDVYLKGSLAFGNKNADGCAWLDAKNDKGEKGLDKVKEQMSVIKDAKIPFVANDYSSIFATSLNGKSIWENIPGALLYQLKEADESLADNIGTFVKALCGLTTITVGPVTNEAKAPWVIVTAAANDACCIDGLVDMVANEGADVVNEGSHCYTIDMGGKEVFVGAQGGFAFLNYGTGKSRPEGNNTIKLERGTSAYMGMVFKNINAMRIPHFGFKELTAWLKNDLSLHGTLTLNKSWKELIENFPNEVRRAEHERFGGNYDD